MIRAVISIVVLSILTGCANMTDFGSPDVYQRSDVQRAGTLEPAVVVRVRRITIQAGSGSSGLENLVTTGLGAFLGSQVIGNGRGRYIAAAVSGAASNFVAQHVSAALSRTAGLEIVVRKADGSLRVVPQPDDQLFSPGDHVLLVDTSSGLRVTH
ncbi:MULTISPECIES: glycine zipper 2TM domain-containing protein [unclassified Paraburkholderia]|uniref:glycine zipper 2TM domain-containing protein n=1 Tax=unclassified Paraburkholderia TaxID=2615204 RepID=UPI002AB19D17|nr:MULTISPECIES: glycine zipper 2TM domain-containing protein [unclassified Paraburkholderia]